MGRVLAVDPGDVHLGVAVSDPTGTIARPLRVLRHVSRERDVQALLETAGEHGVERIVVGVPYGLDGELGPQARRAVRLIDALRVATTIPVVAWDETGSSQAARIRTGPEAMEHARAAAVILQEHLDAAPK
ncbi:MAG: Holliday junction resolvase RuvX [Anaerolineales bacterium]|nr:Holliday junction resolvase RuvX [Anaerolineales bacterium]